MKNTNFVINSLSSAIERNPNNASAYNGRGSAYLTLKYYDLAKKDFEKFLSLVPEDDQTAVQIKQFLNSLE
ncbi:MAG TPA: tetratricopeptide repeat protein [Petrotogaceae bacterium]|jgi:regulator of sirC expression with transglutaminase-like and TPR domain|nr:tetratricopeptide repeat protein [Petrotogaceae bacterium]